MQCYTTQRDPDAFPNPEAFRPERWMELKDVTNEMKELFMPFSKGSRACIGKNLAMMELKLITARLIKQFKCMLAPATTEHSMATMDHFLLIPVGGKCELIFEVV
jgi:cytochrome P450